MLHIDTEAFQKAWFTYEEIQDIIWSEKDFEETWIAYDLDEAFSIIRNNLFSNNNKECIK